MLALDERITEYEDVEAGYRKNVLRGLGFDFGDSQGGDRRGVQEDGAGNAAWQRAQRLGSR